MGDVMKYLKVYLFVVICVLVNTLLFGTLSYFNILVSLCNYLKSMIIVIPSFLGSYYLGSKVNKKGYLEGVKLSLIVILSIFIIRIILRKKLNIYLFIYYLSIILISVIGSILGINKKVRN